MALYSWEYAPETGGQAWVAHWPVNGMQLGRQVIGPSLSEWHGKEHFNAPPPRVAAHAHTHAGARPRPKANAHQARQARARAQHTAVTSALRSLGLSESATWAHVVEAHKRVMLANHPDRNPGNAAAAQRATMANVARDLLRTHFGK